MKYSKPELKLIQFSSEDVLTASSPEPEPQYLRQSNYDAVTNGKGSIDFNMFLD